MTPGPHAVLASTGTGAAALDTLNRFLAWLGELTLGLIGSVSTMISQGNQEMAEVPASSQLGAPAILMAGGLVTLSILFAVMLVRKNPAPVAHGKPTQSPQESTSGPHAHPTSQDAGGQGSSTSQTSRSAGGRAPQPVDAPVAAGTVEAEAAAGQGDDADEEIALTMSTAGSLGPLDRGDARSNGMVTHRGGADDRASRVLAVDNREHQDLLQRGRQAGARFDGNNVHALLEHMRETGIAEPRVLKTVPHLVRVRLVHCRGCTSGSDGNVEGVARCPFEEGFLEGAFKQIEGEDVVVREIACRQRGDPGCDFEVWF